MMRSALSPKKPIYPASWAAISNGELIKQELEQACAPIMQQLFGYHLVRLGTLSGDIQIPSCPIKHIVNLVEQPCAHANMRGLSRDLPLQQSSVDAFLLAAELDFAQDPHQILREIDRAITANGHVVIAGFNPFSIAGLLKYLPINRGNLLHQGRFFTSARIKDWLQLLGFEIIRHEHVLYSSLFAHQHFGIGSAIQAWCKRYFPGMSSMYIIVARKREIPLSTIKPTWKVKKPQFSAAGASARNHHAP